MGGGVQWPLGFRIHEVARKDDAIDSTGGGQENKEENLKIGF